MRGVFWGGLVDGVVVGVWDQRYGERVCIFVAGVATDGLGC